MARSTDSDSDKSRYVADEVRGWLEAESERGCVSFTNGEINYDLGRAVELYQLEDDPDPFTHALKDVVGRAAGLAKLGLIRPHLRMEQGRRLLSQELPDALRYPQSGQR